MARIFCALFIISLSNLAFSQELIISENYNAKWLDNLTNLSDDLTDEQVYMPGKLEVDNIPGMSTVKVRCLISGKAKYSIEVNSAKGGVHTSN